MAIGLTNKTVRKRQAQTWGWTVLSVSLAILLLLVVSTIDNPDGTPWLESTLIGQTLALLGVIAAASFPSLFAARRDAAVVREQVENRHVEDPTKISNVRDDLDNKHDVTNTKLDKILTQQEQILETQKEHSGAIIGFRKDLRQLRDVDKGNGDDIRDVRGSVTTLSEKVDKHLDWSQAQVEAFKKGC